MRINNRRRAERNLLTVVPGNTQAETCTFFKNEKCGLIKIDGLICNVKRCSLWVSKDTKIDFAEAKK